MELILKQVQRNPKIAQDGKKSHTDLKITGANSEIGTNKIENCSGQTKESCIP